MEHRLVLLLVLALGAMSAAPASAQQGQTESSDLEVEARARFQLAQLYYSQARFAQAAAEFEAAYAIHPHPLLLHNIYLARRDLGDLEGAVDALSRYLEAADDLSAADRRVLEGRLATTRRQIAERAPAAEPTEPTETPDELAEDGEPSDTDPDVTTPEGPATSSGIGIVPGAVVLGVGVAAMIGAIVSGAMAEGVRAERDGLCTLPGGACPTWVDQDGYVSQFSAARDAGWGLLVGGAVTAAVGAVLLGVGASEPSESVAVSAGCDGAGCMAAVSGTF